MQIKSRVIFLVSEGLSNRCPSPWNNCPHPCLGIRGYDLCFYQRSSPGPPALVRLSRQLYGVRGKPGAALGSNLQDSPLEMVGVHFYYRMGFEHPGFYEPIREANEGWPLPLGPTSLLPSSRRTSSLPQCPGSGVHKPRLVSPLSSRKAS